jgi:oligosaccharide repeat unit polymerase
MWMVVLLFFVVAVGIAEGLVRDPIAIWLARLYLGWWGLHLLVSSMDPLDMYPVSGFAYLVLLLHVGMFAAGFVAVDRRLEPLDVADGYGSLARGVQDQVARNRTVLVILVGFAFYLLWYYQRFLAALEAAGPAEARNLRYGLGAVFGTPIEILIYNGFAEALAVALVILIAYSLVLGTIRSWVVFWALVDVILFSSIGAGRTLIVQAAIFILVLAVLRNTLQPTATEEAGAGAPVAKRKSLLLFVVVPGALIAVFMVVLTFVRVVSLEAGLDAVRDPELVGLVGQALFDQVWIYAVGPFRALDHALGHPFVFGFHFGRLTFSAVDEMIGLPLRMIGVDYPIMNRDISAIVQDEAIFIGSGDFNALYTGVIRFYYDFGVPGVVVLSLVFGASLRLAVQWFQGYPSPVTLAVMLFLFGAAILCTQTWHLGSLGALVFLGGAYLLRRSAAPS